MISDLKLGLRILRYGHGIKSTIIGTLIVVIGGAGLAVLDSMELSMGGIPFPIGYFMMLASMFIIQLFYSVNTANMIQSSPMKKKLQTSVPTVLNVFTMLCGYLVVVLTGAIGIATAPEAAGHYCQQLLSGLLMMVTVMLYTAVVYKLFFMSTIMFCVVFVLTFSYANAGSWLRSLEGNVEMFWLMAAAGLGALLICGVLHYLISLALYKIPLSKRAQTGALRRQM